MATIKQGTIIALVGFLLVLITACVRVMPGDPPAITLMKADKVNFEGNPRVLEEYQSTLTEIFVKTTTNGLDPNAGADEDQKIVSEILKTRDAMRKSGVKISALEVAKMFTTEMPSDKKTYDLQSIKRAILERRQK